MRSNISPSGHPVSENRRSRSILPLVSASRMLLLARTGRTDMGEGGAFLGICAFTLKIKPSKNPKGKKKKSQAGSCIRALLTRIVNVLGIIKQSHVRYDTSLHAFMSASVCSCTSEAVDRAVDMGDNQSCKREQTRRAE